MAAKGDSWQQTGKMLAYESSNRGDKPSDTSYNTHKSERIIKENIEGEKKVNKKKQGEGEA